jgi:hypothetical protein
MWLILLYCKCLYSYYPSCSLSDLYINMIMERTLYKYIFDNKICLIYFGENKVDVFQCYQLSSFMICLEIDSQRMVQCTAVEFVQSDT